ncbi:DNA primase [Acholeplasma granularum]|uniref:DNA primase n=1 Tax=Acholeplasma granularum TaxID=264635 RepID=UPI0004B9671D|nr:DNA primase [Acholeplasma granularum]
MDQNLYAKINQETDIVSLVSEYVDLTKRGKNYMGLCPFHDEKSPSFSVTPDKQLAYCFGCHKGGSPINFLSQIKNISTHEAAVILGKRIGITFSNEPVIKDPLENLYNLMKDASSFYQFALKNTDSGKIALDYLNQRKIDDDILNHFEIGYAPDQVDSLYKMLRSKKYSVTDMMTLGLVKQNEEGIYYDVFRNRITFPIKDQKGAIIGFSARALNKNEKAKYINSTETPIFKKGEQLYHYSDSITSSIKQKHVILHEGFFDVIASYKAGFNASVATMGTALTSDQVKLLKRITNHVVIAYDGDSAGIDATLKVIPLLKNEKVNVSILNLPNKMDPDDYILKHGKEKYHKLFDKLLDAYQFGYMEYQKGRDFTKADAITAFKKDMQYLLKNADPTIIDLYERKSFDELGIQLLIGNNYSKLPIKEKQIPRQMINRAERAIDTILINLLKENKYYHKIKDNISLTHINNPEKRKLYKDLLYYYEINPNTALDINLFMQGYSKQTELIKSYIETTDYKNNLLIEDDNQFQNIFKHITDYQIQLEINSHIKAIEVLEDESKEAYHLKQIEQLRKQVKNI